jgi:hypothetical protein
VKKIRARLTFANVVACLALFVALGGASYAATALPKSSVGSKQLKNGAVTSTKLKAKAVTAAKLGPGAVGTAALADGAVTGAKVNAGTLGTVPSATHANTADSATSAGDAAALQGRPASAFIQGEGQIFGNTAQLALGQKGVPVLDLPGFGPLTARCEAGKAKPVAYFEFLNTSTTALGTALFYTGGSDGGILGAGEDTEVGGLEEMGAWRWTFTTLTAPARIATLDLSFTSNKTPTACLLTAQATISG